MIDTKHLTPVYPSVLNLKALVGAFNQEKVLVGAFSVIVKADRSFAALIENCVSSSVNYFHSRTWKLRSGPVWGQCPSRRRSPQPPPRLRRLAAPRGSSRRRTRRRRRKSRTSRNLHFLTTNTSFLLRYKTIETKFIFFMFSEINVSPINIAMTSSSPPQILPPDLIHGVPKKTCPLQSSKFNFIPSISSSQSSSSTSAAYIPKSRTNGNNNPTSSKYDIKACSLGSRW